MPDDTTVPSLPADPTTTANTRGGGDAAAPTLFLAYYDGNPGRVGESFPFSDLHLEHVFGRDSGDGSELRVELAARRPNLDVKPVPFEDPWLSRRLVRFTARPFGFEVAKLTPCTLRLAGVETKDAGSVAFGETIQIDDRILFYAAQRPSRLQVRFLSMRERGRFGLADRFGIIGEAAALYRALDALAFAAYTLEHVLLVGESGTGKELFARALHALS